MERHYHQIAEFFATMQEQFNLQICIKDFCGFVPVNKQLDAALQPFLAHTNPYCMYIKQEKQKYYGCLSMIPKMHRRCERDGKSFLGMCHGGLGEYITPIVSGDTLIGTINMGFFEMGEARTLFRIRKLCAGSRALREEEAVRLYREAIQPPTILPQLVLPTMELAAEYLSMTYDTMRATHENSSSRRRYNSSEDTILAHAAEYVRQHFIHPIAAAELAEFCHCSESYLSHIFSRRMGVNINTYINKVRVEASKDFLLCSDASIAEISTQVGFGDPNYYSRVFATLVSIPPSEFRRRFGRIT